MREEEGYLSDQDIFADEDSQPVRSPGTPQIEVARPDSSEVTRLRSMMLGVPPPPEKTNPQIDIPSMLEAWNKNLHLHWEGSGKKEYSKRKNKRKESITNRDLKRSDDKNEHSSDTCKEKSETSDTEEVEEPRFDVYLNLGTEEEEILRQKVAERLISSETSTSFIQHLILTNSARKRQRRNGWAKSPGSRLSYLAKRRTTFCQRPGLSNGRTISILKEDKKPTKDKKSVPLKRALFQSPDKIDFSTPDCSRVKRLKLSVAASPKSGTPPKNDRLPPSGAKRKPSVSRNLESAFNTFVAQSNPDLVNPRQKQLWQRTPLASLPST